MLKNFHERRPVFSACSYDGSDDFPRDVAEMMRPARLEKWKVTHNTEGDSTVQFEFDSAPTIVMEFGNWLVRDPDGKVVVMPGKQFAKTYQGA